jgi:hypothetical protein
MILARADSSFSSSLRMCSPSGAFITYVRCGNVKANEGRYHPKGKRSGAPRTAVFRSLAVVAPYRAGRTQCQPRWEHGKTIRRCSSHVPEPVIAGARVQPGSREAGAARSTAAARQLGNEKHPCQRYNREWLRFCPRNRAKLCDAGDDLIWKFFIIRTAEAARRAQGKWHAGRS